jgi:hypothetical protein
MGSKNFDSPPGRSRLNPSSWIADKRCDDEPERISEFKNGIRSCLVVFERVSMTSPYPAAIR